MHPKPIKYLLKILGGCIAAVILFISVGYVYVAFYGKEVIIQHLEAFTGKKANLAYFDLTFPLNLEIKNLVVEDTVKIDTIMISLDPIALLRGSWVANSITIVNPEFAYARNPPLEPQGLLQKVIPEVLTQSAFAKKPPPRPFVITIKKLNVKEGTFRFADYVSEAQKISVTLKNLNILLTDISTTPSRDISHFTLSGKISWGQKEEEVKKEGSITSEGWFDMAKKDMRASLKIEHIDGIYLYPYYRKWVNLEEAGIIQAELSFVSDIQSLGNDLTAQNRLELTQIVRKERPPETTPVKAERLTDAVLIALKSPDQDTVSLEFPIKTKMDQPVFSFGDVQLAIERKLKEVYGSNSLTAEDLLLAPAHILGGMVKGASDVTKAMIDGTFAVGNELKKGLEASFKREKSE